MRPRTLLLFFFVAYLVSPYAALLKLRQDFRTHDVHALQADIDWDSVRGDLKQDFIDNLAGTPPVTRISTASNDDLPAFGSGFASAMASNCIDHDVTPQRLADAFDTSTTVGGATAQPGIAAAYFDGPTSFMLKMRTARELPTDAPVQVRMQIVRQGWDVRWRVTRVWLPPNQTHMS